MLKFCWTNQEINENHFHDINIHELLHTMHGSLHSMQLSLHSMHEFLMCSDHCILIKQHCLICNIWSIPYLETFIYWPISLDVHGWMSRNEKEWWLPWTCTDFINNIQDSFGPGFSFWCLGWCYWGLKRLYWSLGFLWGSYMTQLGGSWMAF